MANESYPNIDMEKTGRLLKRRIQQAGYTVKDIQEKLFLSCPQPIYRWFQGKVLPSVNHLYVLSNLLNVHMEELLVSRTVLEKEYVDSYTVVREMFHVENASDIERRMLAYFRKMTAA